MVSSSLHVAVPSFSFSSRNQTRRSQSPVVHSLLFASLLDREFCLFYGILFPQLSECWKIASHFPKIFPSINCLQFSGWHQVNMKNLPSYWMICFEKPVLHRASTGCRYPRNRLVHGPWHPVVFVFMAYFNGILQLTRTRIRLISLLFAFCPNIARSVL